MSSYRKYSSFAEAEKALQNFELSNTGKYSRVKRSDTPVEPEMTVLQLH